MGEKLKRTFRGQPLSSEQVAQDREVQKRVREEFPPAASASVPATGLLSELLRQAIRESGKSPAQIAADAGVSPLLLSSFLAGERDIHMATADRVADALGLKLAAT